MRWNSFCLVLVGLLWTSTLSQGQSADPRPQETKPDRVRVAAIQCASEFGASARNLENLRPLIRRAAQKGAKIVVLPETAITGYLSQDLTQTWACDGWPVSDGLRGVDPSLAAETVPGPSTEAFAAMAKEWAIYLTAPLLEFDPKSKRYYNTVALLDPSGELILHYRKRNPWPWAEQGWASEGDLGTPVVETPYGRLGVLICYDIHEQARVVAALEIDCLLYSVAWVDSPDSKWFEERLPEIAKFHGFQIIGANWTTHAATDPDWHGFGQSRIIDRNGVILQQAAQDLQTEVVIADLPIP